MTNTQTTHYFVWNHSRSNYHCCQCGLTLDEHEPEPNKVSVGSLVKVPPFPELYTVSEIVSHDQREPVAVFKEGGFWRCSQLEVAHAK